MTHKPADRLRLHTVQVTLADLDKVWVRCQQLLLPPQQQTYSKDRETAEAQSE